MKIVPLRIQAAPIWALFLGNRQWLLFFSTVTITIMAIPEGTVFCPPAPFGMGPISARKG